MSDHQLPATVHLAPSARDPINKPMSNRWFYILFRTTTLALECATLVYLVWLLHSYSFRTEYYSCAIVAVVLATLLDVLTIGGMLYKPKLSHYSGCCFSSGDAVVVAVGIAGMLYIQLADFNFEGVVPQGPWKHYEDIGAHLVMVVWILHLLISVIHCCGCCSAQSDAKREERAARGQAPRPVPLTPVRPGQQDNEPPILYVPFP